MIEVSPGKIKARLCTKASHRLHANLTLSRRNSAVISPQPTPTTRWPYATAMAQ